MNKLKYPIGHFVCPDPVLNVHIDQWKETIADFPLKLSGLVKDLSDEQLDTCYRKDGWTIRQVVHHCADSHHNSYIRFKWALTEDNPLKKAYFEDRWAGLDDSKYGAIDVSLNFLNVLHLRWITLLNTLTDEHLNRTFVHPETDMMQTLKETLGFYAWHCNHHYAHIYNLLKTKQWLSA